MSMILLVAMVILPVATFGVTVEPLPVSDYADTEVSTNIPFVVGFDAMSRMSFSVSLDASPSNCVEVSIGEDANADGNLSPEEAAYTFGCDCGRWFTRSSIDDREERLPAPVTPPSGPFGLLRRGIFEDADGTVRNEKTFVLRKRKLDEAWNLVKVTRRGKAEIGEVVLVEGKKPGAALIVR